MPNPGGRPSSGTSPGGVPIRAAAKDGGALEERARRWIETTLSLDVEPLEPLVGGSGNRRYWRARTRDGGSRVLMQAFPEDRAILPPTLRREGPAPLERLPFVVMTRFLASHGVPVPELYALEADENWILLEDLGDTHLMDVGPDARRAFYGRAIELIAHVHALPREDALPFRRRFDAEWVRFELDLFAELVPEAERARISAAFVRLADAIAELPQVLSLRDYQSHNLMIDARGELRVIDFQDALLAPRELDLVALLHDSYVELSDVERHDLLERYATLSAYPCPADALAMLTVQRKCKDLSRFRRLVDTKGDARYVEPAERATRSIRNALATLPPAHADLAELLAPRVAGGAA